MNLTRSTIKIFSAKGLGVIITFIGITYFARKLGPHQMGIFFLFQALIGILSIPTDFGLRGAVEKRISEGSAPAKILTTALLLKLFPFIIISIMVILFRYNINQFIGANVAIYIIATLFFHELYWLMVQTINGELRVGKTGIILFARKLVWIGVSTIFVLIGFEAKGLIYGLLTGYIFAFGLGFVRRTTSFGRPNTNQVNSLFKYAKFDFISGAGSRIHSWADVTIIGLFLAQHSVGAYEIAWKITGITLLFSQAIRIVLFPQISEWAAKDNIEQISKIIPKILTGGLFFVLPSFFGFLIFSREILSIVFGSDYAFVWIALIILMLQRIIQVFNDMLGRTLQAMDHPDLAAYGMLISLLLNVILNVYLVWKFGIIGAATATVLSYTSMVLIRSIFLSRFVPIRLPYREIGWCTFSSIVMIMLLWRIELEIVADTFTELIFIILTGIIVYILTIMINPTFRQKVSHIRDRIQLDTV